jgi:hypothetical protein
MFLQSQQTYLRQEIFPPTLEIMFLRQKLRKSQQSFPGHRYIPSVKKQINMNPKNRWLQ